MPKFFVSNEQIKDERIHIIGEDVSHINHVLRLKENDEILVCDKDNGITYCTRIIETLKESIICKILKQIEETTESDIEVTIFQGLPKADKMEYIIQKATELGVKKIIPVVMKRCVVKLEGKDEAKKIDRWQKIAEGAAKQSGRDMIPQVGELIRINTLKEMTSKFDLLLVAYEGEKVTTLKTALKNLKDKTTKKDLKIGIVIGPEGGLEQQEVEELKEKGSIVITLGSRILRTETASITILSNIMYEFEM